MWVYFDECVDIDEEQWAKLDALATREAWERMVHVSGHPHRRGNGSAAMSVSAVDTSGGDRHRGTRFVALSALLPTSSGSTTTN